MALQPLMFLDVESVGLHGEAFAVAFAVVDAQGVLLEEAVLACPREQARGTDADRAWVQAHVPALPATCAGVQALRSAFWQRWLHWKAQGARLVAHCPWPVEARFLVACVDDVGAAAHWDGPYPLLDIASMLQARGQDPMAAIERLPDELPMHDPRADVRLAMRLYREIEGNAARGHGG